VERNIEIRHIGHDNAVFSAHLTTGVPTGLAADLPIDTVTNGSTAGEQHGIDTVIFDDRVARVPVPLYEIEHPIGNTDIIEQFGDVLGTPRRLFGWLPNNSVSLHEGDCHMPIRNRHGEVPRCDTPDNAAGLSAHIRVLACDLGRNHVTVRSAGIARGQLDHVGRFDDISPPF
jgi:hypothetical protein